jgi:hypothetical protein
MKSKQGRRPNATPMIGGMDTLGKKPISGLFSNSSSGKEGVTQKSAGHKDIGFKGKAAMPKGVGFKKK